MRICGDVQHHVMNDSSIDLQEADTECNGQAGFERHSVLEEDVHVPDEATPQRQTHEDQVNHRDEDDVEGVSECKLRCLASLDLLLLDFGSVVHLANIALDTMNRMAHCMFIDAQEPPTFRYRLAIALRRPLRLMVAFDVVTFVT